MNLRPSASAYAAASEHAKIGRRKRGERGIRERGVQQGLEFQNHGRTIRKGTRLYACERYRNYWGNRDYVCNGNSVNQLSFFHFRFRPRNRNTPPPRRAGNRTFDGLGEKTALWRFPSSEFSSAQCTYGGPQLRLLFNHDRSPPACRNRLLIQASSAAKTREKYSTKVPARRYRGHS